MVLILEFATAKKNPSVILIKRQGKLQGHRKRVHYPELG